MRRTLLLFLYLGAALVGIGAFARAGTLLFQDPVAAATTAAIGLAIWWFVAGVGVRMGVTPLDFAKSMGDLFGFRAPDPDGADDPEVHARTSRK